jgi:hypothetical protein
LILAVLTFDREGIENRKGEDEEGLTQENPLLRGIEIPCPRGLLSIV